MRKLLVVTLFILVMLLGQSTLFSASPAPASLGSDVVGLWHFDEGNGDVAFDSSGNDNDGKIYGASWVKGWFGGALQFGDSSYVDVSDTGPEWDFQAFTAEVWINPSVLHRSMEILGEGYKWRIYFSNTNKLIFWVRGLASGADASDVLSYPYPYSEGQWHYVAATYDITTRQMKLYVDGLEVASKITSLEIYADGHDNQAIGKGYVRSPWGFRGVIDEVCILSRELSADEVRERYLHLLSLGLLESLLLDVLGLPSEAFVKEAGERRSALIEKIEAVTYEMVPRQNYKPAIYKMEKGIRRSIEGWIRNPWKTDLVTKIENIIETLRQLI